MYCISTIFQLQVADHLPSTEWTKRDVSTVFWRRSPCIMGYSNQPWKRRRYGNLEIFVYHLFVWSFKKLSCKKKLGNRWSFNRAVEEFLSRAVAAAAMLCKYSPRRAEIAAAGGLSLRIDGESRNAKTIGRMPLGSAHFGGLSSHFKTGW